MALAAEAAGARHTELDIAELGHQPTCVEAVASVADLAPSHVVQEVSDEIAHPRPEHVLHSNPASGPIDLVPFDPPDLNRLHHPQRGG